MDNYEMFHYIHSLIDKYLDKSVYTHDRTKSQFYFDIADRLHKMWILKYKNGSLY